MRLSMEYPVIFVAARAINRSSIPYRMRHNDFRWRNKMASKLAYVRPDNTEEALQFLEDHGHETSIVAGGTDILVDLRAREIDPAYLMDISRLDSLKDIAMVEEGLFIGAGVTLTEIQGSSLIPELVPALHTCTFTFGSRQIRNVATIGGNAAYASPSGDTIPPMIAHEGVALIRNRQGERKVSVEDLASGPYRSTVGPDEIIAGFILQPSKGMSDFQKIGRRKSLSVSRMSMAFTAERDTNRAISFIRLALGACTPTPRRMTQAETFLLGKKIDEEILLEGARLMAKEMIEVTGRRPSTVYKEEAVKGLFMRMLYPLRVK